MRDKSFYINSIKMDLHRVVTMSGDLNKPFPVESATEFLEHALSDYEKIDNINVLEKSLYDNLVQLSQQLRTQPLFLNDPHKRLRWVENVLTTRCRLGGVFPTNPMSQIL